MTSTESSCSLQGTTADLCSPLDQMVCTGLPSLPEEVLIFLSSFLIEEDVLALSNTCVYLKNSLNCNKVWERFISEDMKQLGKILETQEQQVSPPFIPESGSCEAKLNVLRKNRLLDNWRNGRCAVQESSEHVFTSLQSVVFYKEDCLLHCRGGGKLEVWNIQTKPVLLYTKNLGSDSLLVIQDYLVVLCLCLVDVYKINIKDKSLTFRYSFLVPEDKVVYGSKSMLHCEHGMCFFRMTKVKDLLAFSPIQTPNSYILYFWDIANARRVQEFRFQGQFVFEDPFDFLYSQGNQVFFELKEMDQDTWHYFKLDIVTRKLSETLCTDSRFMPMYLFYNKRCLKFSPNPYLQKMVCEIIDQPSSVKMNERCFDNVCIWFLYKLVIVVTSGKIVIPCSDVYHVISATNLETEVIIPHNASSVQVACPVNVYGIAFLLTVENRNEIKVWDLEQKTSVLLAQPEELCINKRHGLWIYGRERSTIENYGMCSWIEEENMRSLHTKMVTFANKRLMVVHFW